MSHWNTLSKLRGIVGAPRFVVGWKKCRHLRTPHVAGIWIWCSYVWPEPR